jgi:LPXTG-site transpeptidase (sortase) family protein
MVTRNKRKQIYIIGVVGICILAALSYAVSHHTNREPLAAVKNASTSQQSTETGSQPSTVNRGLPSKLVIPKLRINAKIVYMGLTDAGEMEVPNHVQDVGWYKYGALPGNKGTAVFAGHLDGLNSEPGVFADLGKLQKGDTFSVIDTKNQTTLFVVREIRTYHQDEKPPEVFNATEGIHLNLITCTGAWNKDQRQFTQRLVVFADQSA